MDIIKRKYIFFLISGLMILSSVAAIFVFGFKPGIEFTGGTLWQIEISNIDYQISSDKIRNFFENELLEKNVNVYSTEEGGFLIRLNELSEEKHQDYLLKLKDRFGKVSEFRYDSIGPAIGKELKNKAVWAMILVLLGISVYVIYAFRKASLMFASWKYGLITLLTLFHDVLIAAGFLAFLGFWRGIELDTKFVVAILVVLGFSVHDTIVVFDRIRENILMSRSRSDLPEIVNLSVNQTIARSINTSLTLVLTLVALIFFGPLSLKYFAALIAVGIIVGTYSSIFIASPLLTIGMKSGK